MLEVMLAKKIKELRRQKSLTIEDIAKKTGFSKSLISKVENGKVTPPIGTLLKISSALDVHIGYFFQEESENESMVIVKKEERKSIIGEGTKKGYVYESLGSKLRHKAIAPFVVTISSEDYHPGIIDQHKGEEFDFVLEGKMEYFYGNKSYMVEEGDALYFKGTIPHMLKPLEAKPVKLLVILINNN